MKFRMEKDALGEVKVPADKYWGAQTQRSVLNFKIGGERVPIEVIHALALIKKAAAEVNHSFGLLDKQKANLIVHASQEVLDGKWNDQFPLVIWQTGSGTQTNMNVNEVIANIANSSVGNPLGSKSPIHPNDHVNKSQSTNDAFPSAINISAVLLIRERLIPIVKDLRDEIEKKSREFKSIVKLGRTHLMDATPLTLGQEFSGYVSQIDYAIRSIKNALPHLGELAIGGTAVGTGLNSPIGFDRMMAKKISQLTGFIFKPSPNKFEAMGSHDSVVEMSGALTQLAVALNKIANDFRWLGSGPRGGIGELVLPSNEPGSSIMPGKVNPTQPEAVTMVAAQIIGNDTTLKIAGAFGNFELNVYRPVIALNIIQSIRLLGDVCESFHLNCVMGIKPNLSGIEKNIKNSLMLVTILSPIIGYDKAAQAAKKAHAENLTLKEAVVGLGFLSEKDYDTIVRPEKMIKPFKPSK